MGTECGLFIKTYVPFRNIKYLIKTILQGQNHYNTDQTLSTLKFLIINDHIHNYINHDPFSFFDFANSHAYKKFWHERNRLRICFYIVLVNVESATYRSYFIYLTYLGDVNLKIFHSTKINIGQTCPPISVKVNTLIYVYVLYIGVIYILLLKRYSRFVLLE